MAGLEAIEEVPPWSLLTPMAGYDETPTPRGTGQDDPERHDRALRVTSTASRSSTRRRASAPSRPRSGASRSTSTPPMRHSTTPIRVADLSGSGSTSKLIPPGGHMAGIYNRTDSERGVHKAPANEVVRGAIDLELRLSKGEQDTLNPIGVNCIRTFPVTHPCLGRSHTEQRRPVALCQRPAALHHGRGLARRWPAMGRLEPNDRMLWARVRRDVTSFLRTLWLGGALFGSTPDEAFYVKCDDELNPPEIRDLGQLIIEVGSGSSLRSS